MTYSTNSSCPTVHQYPHPCTLKHEPRKPTWGDTKGGMTNLVMAVIVPVLVPLLGTVVLLVAVLVLQPVAEIAPVAIPVQSVVRIAPVPVQYIVQIAPVAVLVLPTVTIVPHVTVLVPTSRLYNQTTDDLSSGGATKPRISQLGSVYVK